jgi:hypothetical protein
MTPFQSWFRGEIVEYTDYSRLPGLTAQQTSDIVFSINLGSSRTDAPQHFIHSKARHTYYEAVLQRYAYLEKLQSHETVSPKQVISLTYIVALHSLNGDAFTEGGEGGETA